MYVVLRRYRQDDWATGLPLFLRRRIRRTRLFPPEHYPTGTSFEVGGHHRADRGRSSADRLGGRGHFRDDGPEQASYSRHLQSVQAGNV